MSFIIRRIYKRPEQQSILSLSGLPKGLAEFRGAKVEQPALV